MKEIKLIGCRGGDPEAPRLLAAEGWLYGFRSDYTAYATPYFVDINWQNYDWLDHLKVIKFWKPIQAMVADYLDPSQKTQMLSQVEDILKLGVRPMVCPKFSGAIADIPSACVVAVSVPTSDSKYAGFLPPDSDLIGRDLHLLGGHPDQFAFLIKRYFRAHVISVDCSVMFQKAMLYGAFWSARKSTWRYIKHRFTPNVLTRISARNIRIYLANPASFRKDRKRLMAIGYRLQPSLFEASK